jgi:hypothetical protein
VLEVGGVEDIISEVGIDAVSVGVGYGIAVVGTTTLTLMMQFVRVWMATAYFLAQSD